jgi:hypothetical protein
MFAARCSSQAKARSSRPFQPDEMRSDQRASGRTSVCRFGGRASTNRKAQPTVPLGELADRDLLEVGYPLCDERVGVV